MTTPTIAFIGLGNMGGPMAANLRKAGHRVIGFDVAAGRMDAARDAGVEPADSGPEAAAQADVVWTMLPDAAHVAGAWESLVPAARAGALLVDSSTCDVGTARSLHEKAAYAGLASLDAPVSGGVGGARAGTLTFMVGGTGGAFARAEPLLTVMGQKAVHCGAAGSGQATKICNNMILGVSIVAVSEAFVLAEKLGVAPQTFFDVASTSTGQCWALTSYCPVPGLVPGTPSSNGYAPGAPATMLLKDLRLALQAAGDAGSSPALGEHATEIFQRFVDAGHGGEDFSAIIRALRD